MGNIRTVAGSVNFWRLATLILFAIAVACASMMMDTTKQLARCMLANRALGQAYAEANAEVELATNPRSGDVFVRVNRTHIHQFKGACARVKL